MNVRARRLCIPFALAMLCVSSLAHAWGYVAHSMINAAAVAILPPQMREVVQSRRDALAAHAADPDLWKEDPEERSRHYIDLELGDPGGPPFARIPRRWDEAVRAFGEDSLEKMGTLPWRISSYFDALVRSMETPSESTWVIMAALGHYVADAFMPLHTTLNYDGQFTGNRGIHFRFEWWMIEQHREQIVLRPCAPMWIYDPLELAWTIILDAHADIDTLLKADAAVRRTFRPPIGAAEGIRQPDPEFDHRLWEKLGHLAIYRMNLAAQAVAGYWYAAWLRADKPDLRRVPDPPPPPQAK